MNNYDCIVALLIDFGANMDQVNVGGNTPLHVAASRSCKESTKWLLLRGADTEKLNKSGKRPYECAVQAACVEICDIMEKFTPENIGMKDIYLIYLTFPFISVMPPTRYIPDSVTEYDGIVSNVLAGLSSSIGKEYTPLLYYTKPPTTTGRAKSMMQNRKSMMTQFSAPNVEDMNSPSAASLASSSTRSAPTPSVPGPGSSHSLPSSKEESNYGSKGHMEPEEASLRSIDGGQKAAVPPAPPLPPIGTL